MYLRVVSSQSRISGLSLLSYVDCVLMNDNHVKEREYHRNENSQPSPSTRFAETKFVVILLTFQINSTIERKRFEIERASTITTMENDIKTTTHGISASTDPIRFHHDSTEQQGKSLAQRYISQTLQHVFIFIFHVYCRCV